LQPLFREAGQFWASCKRPGSQTVHGHLRRNGDTIESVDDKFTVTYTTPDSVTVQCNYTNGGCKTTFIRPVKTFHLHQKKLTGMDISGSGGLGICVSENGKAWVWDPDNGETRRELKGHVIDVETCRFFPSGIVILTGGVDMRLKIWSAQDGSCPRTFVGHTGGISDTAIIDKGRNFVSVSRDGTARLWDCGTGRCLDKLTSIRQPINSCSLSASEVVAQRNPSPPLEPECGTNDKLLALACGDRYLRGVDVRSRKSVFQFSCGDSCPQSCVFVSEFDLVCGCDDGLVTQLDVRMPDQALQLYHTSSAVTSLAVFTPQSCIAGHADGSVLVWRCDNLFTPVSKLTGPDIDHVTNICLRGDKIYTSCRDGFIRIYSTEHISLS
jgi:proteasomal ATPase-associated factor 1